MHSRKNGQKFAMLITLGILGNSYIGLLTKSVDTKQRLHFLLLIPAYAVTHCKLILTYKNKHMASIKNLNGITDQELLEEIRNGAKFVVYQYCVSILIMTFKRGSDIYFIRSGESALKPGLPFTALTFFFGWWGIPWGPIYTIGSFITNFSGGKDITHEVLASMNAHLDEVQEPMMA
jgi:hypothetical protein